MKELKQISETDACYFAGYFDGEGCISINWRGNKKKAKTFDLKIAVSCTFESVIQHMANVLGGIKVEHKWKIKRLGKARQWIWQAGNLEAAYILRSLLPYMIVKRDEAELAIRFQEHVQKNVSMMHSRNLEARDTLRAERHQMRNELQSLRKAKMQYAVQTETVQ